MVINISFGYGNFSYVCDESEAFLAQVFSTAAAAGISTFSSSGNDGDKSAMASPACLSDVISVGAVYDDDFSIMAFENCTDYYPDSDEVTCYSNSTTFLDLLAPSHNVTTLDIMGSGGYSTGMYSYDFGGTSSSSPYAAGAAALIQSAAKQYSGAFYTPSELKQKLSEFGDRIKDTNGVLTARINVNNVLKEMVLDGDINFDATVDLKDSLLPLQILSGSTPQLTNSMLGEIGNDQTIDIHETLHAMQIVGEVCSIGYFQFCNNESSCNDGGFYWRDNTCNTPVTTEIEPNETPDEATFFALDAPISGNMIIATDVDWYVFRSDKAGTIATVKYSTTSFTPSAIIEAYNPQGEQINWFSAARDGFLHLNLAEPGLYYLSVSSYNSEVPGGYQLSVFTTSPQEVPAIESEVNNTLLEADPLNFDTPMSGVLSDQSDTDWFVIENETSRVVTVACQPYTDCNAAFEVFSEDHTLLARSKLTYEGIYVNFEAQGKYYISLSDNPSLWWRPPGTSYGLIVHSNDEVDVGYAESEKNDIQEQADTLLMGSSIRGITSTADDVDWFKVYNLEPGIVSFSLEGDDWDSWRLSVYDANDVLHADSSAGSGLPFHVQFQDTGWHYIKIVNPSPSTNELPLQYTLTVTPDDSLATTAVEKESNDTREHANPVPLGTTVSGMISTNFDTDWYMLEIDSEKTIKFEFTAGSKELLWQIDVSDSTGQLLRTVLVGNNSSYHVSLPAAGMYHFTVIGIPEVNSGFEGKYSLTLTDSGIDGQLVTEIEDNGSPETANSLHLNEQKIGHLISESDEDWYAVEISAPQVLSANFSIVNNYARDRYVMVWKLDVYDSSLLRLASYDVSESENVFALPAAGKYYIAISDNEEYWSCPDNEYRLELQPTTLNVEDFESENNNDYLSADPLSLDQFMTGSITSEEDVDWYTFDINSSTNITVSFASSGISEFFNLKAYDKDMNVLAEQNAGDGTMMVTEMITSGTYYLTVSDNPSYTVAGGTYSVSVTASQ